MIFLHQTRDLTFCKKLKADELRVWAGLISMVDSDLEIPLKGMISKRCFVRTSIVTTSLRTLEANSFLNQTKVNSKYASFESQGRGSVPFDQENLKDLSRNRTLHRNALRVFYYLLGDIRRNNIVPEGNITRIAEALKMDRGNTSRIITQLKDEDFLKASEANKKKFFVISRSALGTLKRS